MAEEIKSQVGDIRWHVQRDVVVGKPMIAGVARMSASEIRGSRAAWRETVPHVAALMRATMP